MTTDPSEENTDIPEKIYCQEKNNQNIPLNFLFLKIENESKSVSNMIKKIKRIYKNNIFESLLHDETLSKYSFEQFLDEISQKLLDPKYNTDQYVKHHCSIIEYGYIPGITKMSIRRELSNEITNICEKDFIIKHKNKIIEKFKLSPDSNALFNIMFLDVLNLIRNLE